MVRRVLRCSILLAALLTSPWLAVAQEPIPTSVAGTVIVEWSTESEVNLAGFNIHRSESPAGPYVRLNDTLIPAAPDPIAGGSYSFTDDTAGPGVTYYYQLEDVELDGSSTMHGPIEILAEAETISHLDVAKSVALAMLVGLLLIAGLMAMGIGRRTS